MVSFIDFYFHFLAYVQTSRGSDLDFASFVFYKLLYLPMFICYFSDTHSEPGLPVDKHVVNEHHVIRKSPALVLTPHKKNVFTWCISMYHVIGLKQTRGIKNVALKAAKKFEGVAVYWEE